jgi:hypothetical protein
MSTKTEIHKERILELIAAHGLEAYGLYMYILTISTENPFYDEWLVEVVGVGHLKISAVVATCVELNLLEFKREV